MIRIISNYLRPHLKKGKHPEVVFYFQTAFKQQRFLFYAFIWLLHDLCPLFVTLSRTKDSHITHLSLHVACLVFCHPVKRVIEWKIYLYRCEIFHQYFHYSDLCLFSAVVGF